MPSALVARKAMIWRWFMGLLMVGCRWLHLTCVGGVGEGDSETIRV